MESPLVAVFLAVIALTALLQAGFVAAVAFGVRMGNQKLSEFEAQFEGGVVPRIREAAKLTDQAASLAEKTLAQAQRMDGVVADASHRAERYMDDAAAKLENVAARAAMRVDSELAMRAERVREHRIVRRLSSARSRSGRPARPPRPPTPGTAMKMTTTRTSTPSRPTPARPEG
jgi:hypothetical protein